MSTCPFKINPVLQKIPYAHPYGDLMCGQNQWLRAFENVRTELSEGSLRPLLLDYISANGWEALSRINILDGSVTAPLLHGSKYKCPYTHQVYSSLVPVMILSRRTEDYALAAGISPSMQEMACDDQWNLDRYEDFIIEGKLSQIQELLLGSGYTSVCLMSDGSSSVERLVMDLDNGDKIVFAAYVWHNK